MNWKSDSLFLVYTQVSAGNFADALDEGWKPDATCLGAESLEYLQMMSWVGRRSAVKLVQHLANRKDWFPVGVFEVSKFSLILAQHGQVMTLKEHRSRTKTVS